MPNRILTRRDFLLATGVAGGTFVLGIPKLNWAQMTTSKKSSKLGTVQVIVFSNFEGWLQNVRPAALWFEACSKAHPSIVWTHMYSPRYLVVKTAELIRAGAEVTSYLLKAQASGRVEVGLHIHLFYDLITQLGVRPRAFPFAGDRTASCNYRRTIVDDRTDRYDVLITGYSPQECSKILDASTKAFVDSGLLRPKAFCAGYSADRLLDWSGHITPLTIPYRVATGTILPLPHVGKGVSRSDGSPPQHGRGRC
jgi:hypothetical protein